jgi:hypothetical protein
MLGAMKVLGSVLVLGRIATTHVTTLQAKAEMNPCVSGFDAVLTNVFVCALEFDVVEMSAISHKVLRYCFSLMLRTAQPTVRPMCDVQGVPK